ncbi:MAG: hypothetical protein QOF72_1284 [Blastocatellia bacterium]|jgi:hypothetical protein|nr:hypothetical protein [Blastocatellia bacterium]
MNDSENKKHQAFVRSQGFGVAHGDDFAATSFGKQLFATLGTIVTELDGHAATEASGFGLSRQGTTTRSQAREALRDDLEAINRTARAMASDVPGIDDKFRIPRNNNDQHLLHAARAFAADAEPLAAQFIAHELPADFLEDLNADIAALEGAINSQSSGKGDHVAARAAIDDAIARGTEVLRKLDAIVKNKYANNPSVLAEWLSASHVERAPKRKASAPAPPPPTPPASEPEP